MGKKVFTLVETMIITAIIFLLAAVVIPSLLKMKIKANEQAAIGAAKNIYVSARNFASVNSGRYPKSLDVFENAQVATSVSGKSGYRFNYLPLGNPPAGFWVSIEPSDQNTGTNFYYVDERGVVCDGKEPAKAHATFGSSCPENFKPVQ